MSFTDAQQETLHAPDRRGLHFNSGEPCECGTDADTSTHAVRKYSDTMLYEHRCACGATWSTWTEG